jgi:hypothetical protein
MHTEEEHREKEGRVIWQLCWISLYTVFIYSPVIFNRCFLKNLCY